VALTDPLPNRGTERSPGGGTGTTRDQCKKYGWTDYGAAYKNQGSCVSTNK